MNAQTREYLAEIENAAAEAETLAEQVEDEERAERLAEDARAREEFLSNLQDRIERGEVIVRQDGEVVDAETNATLDWVD
jgi:hypothetical protein